MAHMPMDDVQQLWGQMGAKRSWSSLRNALESRQGRAEGINDNLIQPLVQDAQQMERQNRPFPNNAQQLYNELNRNLERMKVK